ncbi:MAG: hypothetical protein GEU83_01830 [Pseudonocardiaceae bacterium]|nr:hypothetical protein [Pseudonocardiaceae bacterium]
MKTLLSRLRELITTLLSRLRQRPVLTSIAAVALVLSLGLGITGLVLDDDSDEVANEAGGYQLMAPDDWDVTQEGPITKLASPGKDALISVTTGYRGPLNFAGAVFFQQVGRNYEETKLTGVQGERVGSRPALIYSGQGVNKSGVKVNFLAITVEGQPRNYAISVFTAANSDAQQILPRVNSVVDTFRALDKR